MKRIVCVFSVLMAMAAGAAEKTWKAGVIDWPADGWTNGDYWEGGAPGAEDTAMFACAVTARVTKANCEDVNGIRQISAKWMYDFRLELDSTDGDFDFDCMLGGTAWAVKKGAGTVQLTSNRKAAQAYGYYTDFGCNRLVVRAGTLRLPNVATGYYLPVLEIDEGATFAYAATANAIIGGLAGAGTFANASGAVRNIQIGAAGAAASHVFAGKVGDFNLSVYIDQRFVGTENEALNAYVDYGSGEVKTYGVLGFAKLGMADGSKSSVGTGTSIDARRGGRLLYLGSGETSNKEILYRTDNAVSPVLDGGVDGGLVLTGNVHPYDVAAAQNKMGELILDGENTNACVIAGYYNTARMASDGTEVTIYTTKRGPGVWRFADYSSRTGTGGYGVLEGTLQFASIAEKGVNCSLGRATRLAECYYGDWDESKAVSYAYRLGDADSTNAVFEYVGTAANACSTRPIAMGGEAHLRANGAAGAPLDFAGVSVLPSGPETKTLILDGTNTDANVLGDVDDAGGRLSLVKDGPGAWTLDRDQTFHGDLTVKAGTLTVRKNVFPTWFKLTIKNVSDPSKARLYFTEFALYDEDGIRVTKDMAFVPGQIELVSGNNYTTRHQPQNLKPGEFTWGDTSAARYLYREDAYAMDKLFDGKTDFAWMARVGNKIPDGSTSAYDFVLVMRVDSAKPVKAFDLVQYFGDAYPTSIEIESSVNGIDWVPAYANTALENHSGNWYSDRKPITTAEPRLLADEATVAMDISSADDGYSVLRNVSSVSVAPGATLNTSGTYVPEIATLVVDGRQGAGTISGFRLAKNMTVEVVDPEIADADLAVGFEGLAGFDEVESWTYTVDGQPQPKLKFKLSQTSLKVEKVVKGLMLIFR